jgi:DtxR family transcriptional regulator, Mn-dependent transcriptional regulator
VDGAPTESHPCAGPTAVEARYLLAILELAREPAARTQAELARRVGVAAPTTLQMVRRLRELGFVHPGSLELTEAGTSAALVLRSRRAAAHALAHDVLGLDEELSLREADHLASAVSPALGRRLVARRTQANRPEPR